MRFIALLAGAAYLIWRAAFTWAGTNLVLFSLLLVAEAYGILRTQIELELMRRPRRPRLQASGTDTVAADVIVLALDEPTSEIRAALLSARAIQGRGQVTLVDRDGRPELAELAQRLEVAHVTGSARADVGALLNKAATRGFSDRIVMLPGDVVTMPDITTLTGPCFDDPEVAVVLGQIEATNAAHEVDFDGYGQTRAREAIVSPSLDADHALPWWNGVSLIRRDALEEVGGFATGRRNVTLATGVRLQVGGWRVAASDEVVARRLASWTDDRHLHRWSRDLHERLELLRRPDISWASPRITPRMRLAYRSALVDGTRGLQRLVLIAILLATLAGAGLPVAGSGVVIIGAWSTQMGLRLLARWLAMRPIGFQSWILPDIRLLTTELVVGWRVLQGRRLEEDLHDSAPGQRLRTVLLWTLHVALTAGIALTAFGLLRTNYGDLATLATLVASAWLWLVALRARSSLRLRQVRQSFRATEELDVLNSSDGLAVVGVSPFGIDVVSTRKMNVGDRLRLAFALPLADGSSTRMETATVVRRVSKESGGRYVAYLRFALITDEEMDRVIEYCAVVAGHRDMRHREVRLGAELVDNRDDDVFEDDPGGAEAPSTPPALSLRSLAGIGRVVAEDG